MQSPPGPPNAPPAEPESPYLAQVPGLSPLQPLDQALPIGSSGKPPPNTAVAALVLGILSLLGSWLCFGPFIGIAAIVLGVVARNAASKDPTRAGAGMAMAGIVLGVLSLLMLAAVFAFGIAAGMLHGP